MSSGLTKMVMSLKVYNMSVPNFLVDTHEAKGKISRGLKIGSCH